MNSRSVISGVEKGSSDRSRMRFLRESKTWLMSMELGSHGVGVEVGSVGLSVVVSGVGVVVSGV